MQTRRALLESVSHVHGPSRRTFLQGLGASVLGVAQPPLRRYRVLLNSNVSGPQAFFFLAQDRGYYRDAGLEPEFVGGDGAAAIVARVGPERFDFGYGDLNALVPLVARGVADAPIAVYVAFNTTPLTIAVDASGRCARRRTSKAALSPAIPSTPPWKCSRLSPRPPASTNAG